MAHPIVPYVADWTTKLSAMTGMADSARLLLGSVEGGSMDAEVMARLDRIEATLERMARVLDRVEPTVAMTADIADEWVSEKVGGAEMEARLAALEEGLLRVSRPEVLEALTRLAERAPRLERLAELAAGFDDHVAMTADIADEWVSEKVGGAEMEARLAALEALLLDGTRPEVLDALRTFTDLLPRLRASLDAAELLADPEVEKALVELASLAPRLVRAARLAAELDPLVAGVAEALHEPAEPLGPLGLFSALRDPDVKQGVGRAIHITRHLGRNDKLLPIKP